MIQEDGEILRSNHALESTLCFVGAHLITRRYVRVPYVRAIVRKLRTLTCTFCGSLLFSLLSLLSLLIIIQITFTTLTVFDIATV